MTAELTEDVRKGIISFSITDKGALYAAYMQYVTNGGVFVPTNRGYELGDSVFMLLKLMEDQAPIPIDGKIVWITPPGSQGNKTPGVGVQFGEDRGRSPKTLIEEYLAASLQGDRDTHTM